MLIDDVKIRVIAGGGGKGSMSFDKNLMTHKLETGEDIDITKID